MSGRKRIAILGSTGSIGRQALEVAAWHPDRFEIVALAARSDAALFREQVRRFAPRIAALTGRGEDGWCPDATSLRRGEDSLIEAATAPDVDLLLVATSGTAGLAPTLAALELGRPVALANKEVLIMAGHLVMRTARRTGAPVIPVDSEHSAVWQCLFGEDRDCVRKVILTASGGAFRDLPLDQLADVTPAQALQHPNWSMGPKITVDSATMMNKGLEVLEACWLFDLAVDDVEIVLHRESIVHSLVEFVDGSVKAQLSTPDMRLPIQLALSYPERISMPTPPLDLVQLGRLSFSPLEPDRFRSFFLAIEAGRLGGTYPTVMNAANEVAVDLFLSGSIGFGQIPALTEAVMDRHVPTRDPALDAVYAADAWAREACRRLALASVTA
ncbi:MAG: 1-deoxy-D-xylulose-5-phosphate reductoisomerase [Chloroflexota bacterium]|nr:1-deoxy-D-xylulose-5-phosphate reductoisomerase [Chloroflexota bacterium]